MVRFGRSAAQIFQNGLRQLGLLGCPPCSPSAGPFRPLSSPNPSKRTSPACYAWLCSLLPLVVRFGGSAAQPNPPKRTSPASSAWPCSLLSSGGPFWPLSSPNLQNGPRSLLCWAVLLALPLVVRFGRSAAQILQNGPRQLRLLGCAPCSPSLWWSVLAAQQPESFKTDLPSSPARPFWPLSSPNPSKRTSQACYAGLCSLLSLWWSVLAAQQPKSSKTDLPNNRWMCTARFEPSIFRLRVLPSAD